MLSMNFQLRASPWKLHKRSEKCSNALLLVTLFTLVKWSRERERERRKNEKIKNGWRMLQWKTRTVLDSEPMSETNFDVATLRYPEIIKCYWLKIVMWPRASNQNALFSSEHNYTNLKFVYDIWSWASLVSTKLHAYHVNLANFNPIST